MEMSYYPRGQFVDPPNTLTAILSEAPWKCHISSYYPL